MLRTPSLLLVFLALALATPPAAGQPSPPASGDESDDAPAGEDTEAPAPPTDELDVATLREQYLRLRDRLFRARARAASVASAMYSTKLRIDLAYQSGRHYTVQRATIRLDGANVYDDIQGTIAEDDAPRFEGYVAPGRHLVSIRIEAAGKDDDRFTSVMENTFVVMAPAGKDVVVSAKAEDAGDVPYRWQRKERGSYRLHLDVDVEAVERSDDQTE